MNKKKPTRSLRGAINANCRSCIYDSAESGSWRKQVENCAILACSIHPVRPRSIKGKAGNKEPPIASDKTKRDNL